MCVFLSLLKALAKFSVRALYEVPQVNTEAVCGISSLILAGFSAGDSERDRGTTITLHLPEKVYHDI